MLLHAVEALPYLGDLLRTHPLRALRGQLGRRGWAIADVGGGSGRRLRQLRLLGYRRLTCIDPFIEESGEINGITFVRGILADVAGPFDLIMYHHSLEHIADPVAELTAVSRRLTARGVALVRLPWLPNAAFERYGADWVQLDAPRHLHIPSREGLRQACARAGLWIVAEGDDSTALQFWGSERYRAGLSLVGGPSLAEKRQVSRWGREARRLNRAGRGDQGWLLLRPVGAASSVQ